MRIVKLTKLFLLGSVLVVLGCVAIVEFHYRRDLAAALALEHVGGAVEFGNCDNRQWPLAGIERWPAARHLRQCPIRLLLIDAGPEQMRLAMRFANAKSIVIADLSDVSEERLAIFLSRFEQLEKFRIPYANITGRCLEPLGTLTEMKSIGLEGTNISDDGVKILASLNVIESLDLSRTHVTDLGISHLSGMAIQELNVDYCSISDKSAVVMESLRGLKSLSVSGTSFGNSGVERIGRTLDLEKFCASGCPLSDVCIISLNKFTSCTLLDVSDTQLTNQGVAQLGPFDRLEVLNISCTDITDLGSNLRHRFPALSRIVVHRGQLTEPKTIAIEEQLPGIEVYLSPFEP